MCKTTTPLIKRKKRQVTKTKERRNEFTGEVYPRDFWKIENNKYILNIAIPSLPKMPNVTIWSNNFKVNDHNKNWYNIIYFSTRKYVPKSPIEKYKIKLTRYASREPDYDGLVGSFKPVVDGLIKANIIKDDKLSNSGKWDVNWVYEKTRKNGRIEIYIEEVK